MARLLVVVMMVVVVMPITVPARAAKWGIPRAG